MVTLLCLVIFSAFVIVYYERSGVMLTFTAKWLLQHQFDVTGNTLCKYCSEEKEKSYSYSIVCPPICGANPQAFGFSPLTGGHGVICTYDFIPLTSVYTLHNVRYFVLELVRVVNRASYMSDHITCIY